MDPIFHKESEVIESAGNRLLKEEKTTIVKNGYVERNY